MKVLAIDSSGLIASVAILEDDTMLAEYTVNYKKTHSQTLLPMIEEITKMIDLELSQLDAIAIASGPGSFTGLRIGAGTAKGLGLALKIPIIPVPTLKGLAYNISGDHKLVCPIMDARRNQVYTGIYKVQNHNIETVLSDRAISIQELIKEINELKQDIIFVGDGIKVFCQIIEQEIQVNYYYGKPHLNKQRAGSIGVLAMECYKNNEFVHADNFAPHYLRLSQAEREFIEKSNGDLI